MARHLPVKDLLFKLFRITTFTSNSECLLLLLFVPTKDLVDRSASRYYGRATNSLIVKGSLLCLEEKHPC
jgi:hypothetical protein